MQPTNTEWKINTDEDELRNITQNMWEVLVGTAVHRFKVGKFLAEFQGSREGLKWP